MGTIFTAPNNQYRPYVVNVKTFGAKGDGITDDTAAIKAAIASITDGVVVFPQGNYVINETLTITGKVMLEGMGSDVTTLDFSSASSLSVTTLFAKNYSVCIALTGSQIYCKSLTVLGNASAEQIAFETSIVDGGFLNVSTTNIKIGLYGTLENTSITDSGTFANCKIGVLLTGAKSVVIQKQKFTANTLAIDLPNDSNGVTIDSVYFSSCDLALRVADYCRTISVVNPTIEGMLYRPWIINPTSDVEFIGVTSPKDLLEKTARINFLDQAHWTATAPAETTIKQSIKSDLRPEAPDDGIPKVLVIPTTTNSSVYTYADQLGVLDLQIYGVTSQTYTVNVYDKSDILWYQCVTPGLLEDKNPPLRIFGSLLDEYSKGTPDGAPYKIEIVADTVHPYYIKSASLFETNNPLPGPTSWEIDIFNGMHIHNWGIGYNDFSLNISELPDVTKFLISFWARTTDNLNGDSTYIQIFSKTNGKIDQYTFIDNREYYYFESVVDSSDVIVLYKDEAIGIELVGLSVIPLYDSLQSSILLSAAPTYGWWPLGTLVYNASGGAGWTCVDNSTFPNEFATIAGDSLEFTWSGTALGVRLQGTTTWEYQELAGISGLMGPQGPAGATGATGASGANGLPLEYDWDGTSLGVRVSGVGSYTYVNLSGAVGPQGPQGPQGETGASGQVGSPGPALEFAWSGTSLGVRVSGVGDYTYQDVAGISGIQGPQGDTGKSIEYSIVGDQIGFRQEGDVDYTWTPSLTGPTGTTGAAGAPGVTPLVTKNVAVNGISTFYKLENGLYSQSAYQFYTYLYSGTTALVRSQWEMRQTSDQVYIYSSGSNAYNPAYSVLLTTFTPNGAGGGTATTIFMPGLIVETHEIGLIKYGASGATGATGAIGATGPAGAQGATGSGLMYDWAGTSLGVKTYDEVTYEYVDLQGPAGTASGIYVNIEDFGANTALSDNTSFIQDAVNYASSQKIPVMIPGNLYKVTGVVNLPSNTHVFGYAGATISVEGKNANLSGNRNRPAFRAEGSSGVHNLLFSSAVEGTSTIVLPLGSTANAGDYFKIYSTGIFGYNNYSTAQYNGEIVQVSGTSGGGGSPITLTLYDKLHDTYLTTEGARAYKITPVENVTIRDLQFVGSGALTTQAYRGVELNFTKNTNIRGCEFNYIHDCAVHYENSIFGTIENCTIENALYDGLSYGVISSTSQDILVSKIFGKNLRHLAGTGGGSERTGVTRRFSVDQCNAINMRSHGFDAHATSEYVSFTNNFVDGTTSDGINCDGAKTRISNNTIRNCSRDGILVRNYTKRGLDYSIQGNHISECGRAGINIGLSTIAEGAPNHALLRNWKACTISDNTVINVERSYNYGGIWLYNTDYTVYRTEHANIFNNYVYLYSGSTAPQGIHVQGFTDLNILGNHVINNSSGVGIQVDRCTNTSVNNNIINGTSASTSYGVFFYESSGVNARYNEIDAFWRGIYIDNITALTNSYKLAFNDFSNCGHYIAIGSTPNYIDNKTLVHLGEPLYVDNNVEVSGSVTLSSAGAGLVMVSNDGLKRFLLNIINSGGVYTLAQTEI